MEAVININVSNCQAAKHSVGSEDLLFPVLIKKMVNYVIHCGDTERMRKNVKMSLLLKHLYCAVRSHWILAQTCTTVFKKK